MSIYRRANSKVWWMNIYRGPGRKRIRKSTGKENEAEARIVEQGYVAMNKGEATRERLLRLVDVMCPAEAVGMKLEDLGSWYRACAKDEGLRISAKGLDDRVNLCGRLSEWARRETRCHVTDDITPPVAWEFSMHLGREGVSAKSRNDYVSSLGTVWKMLMKRAKATANPWTLAKVQRNRDEEDHGRAFTREEEARLMEAARKAGHEWYEASVIARWTGMRLTDVRHFRWDEIDWESGWIHYRPKKTTHHAIKVDMPMHPKLRKMLEDIRERVTGAGDGNRPGAVARSPHGAVARSPHGAVDGGPHGAVAGGPRGVEWVLPERHRNNGKKYSGTDCPYSAIIRAAGIEAKKGETITFHCWRHTFDTRLSEAGVEQDTRMAMTGHRVRETETIYNHDRTRMEKAIGKMK